LPRIQNIFQALSLILNKQNDTNTVKVRFAERIPLLNKTLSLLNCRLEAKASIEIGDIFVDSFEVDTKCNIQFPFFYFLVDFDGIVDCIITSNQIKLIYSSSDQTIHYFLDIERGLRNSQKTTTVMMDSFDDF
jgi:hypothetical protein